MYVCICMYSGRKKTYCKTLSVIVGILTVHLEVQDLRLFRHWRVWDEMQLDHATADEAGFCFYLPIWSYIYTHIIMMIWSIICMWSWMVLCAEHVCTHDITWVEIHPRSFFSDLVFSVGLSEHGNIKLWVIAVPKFQWLSWQQIGPASPSISSLRTTFTVSIILKRLQK
jgi:hypothetical protein